MAGGVSYQVHIDGKGDIDAALRRLRSFSMRDTFNKVGVALVPIFSGQVFASRGGVIGESWAGLSQSTQQSKSKRYPGRPPLVATGEMQGSFTADASDDRVEISNRDPKFKFHQGGTSKMPARKMLKLAGLPEQTAVKIIGDDFKTEVQKAWGGAAR